MFNLGFLWLALSIGSEITGTSMIKKTNGFSKLAPSVLVVCAYGLCYFALTRAMSTICGRGLLAVVRLRYRRRHHLLHDPL